MDCASTAAPLGRFLWQLMVIISLLAIGSSREYTRNRGGDNLQDGERARSGQSSFLDSSRPLNASPLGLRNLKSFGTPAVVTGENEDINEEGDGNSSSYVRETRDLKKHGVSPKVIMLFYDKDKNINETYESIKYPNNTEFDAEDFIIRLQEKYEYTTCTNYLDAAKEVANYYFRQKDIDDLVEMANDGDTEFKGTHATREERRKKANKTMPKRYRLYDEPCDPDAEWLFWRDMFIAAENDTQAIPKGSGIIGGVGGGSRGGGNSTTTQATSPITTPPPGPGPNLIDEEYNYVQVNPRDMMSKWNDIWIRYRNKGVCYQKFLLECDVVTKTCKCRSHAVGLSSVIYQDNVVVGDIDVGDEQDIFTTQYYEDLYEDDKGKGKIRYGEYLHKKKCVLTANLPRANRDIGITNPCDFFLPMIGLCKTECVVNATCQSVNEKEKAIMKTRNSAIDFYVRIMNQTLHETYHQKCVCKQGKICRKVEDITYGGAPTFRKAPPMTFTSYNHFFIFQTILALIIFKY